MKSKLFLTLASVASFSFSLVSLSVAVAAGPEAAPAPKAPAAKIDWEKMSKADRKKYMKTTVLPEMKKLFVAVDAKHYAKFNCQTCHGSKATEVKFKMPSAELPKLPAPTDRAGFMALQQKKPDVVKFMGTQVKPKMAELLGLAEWTPTSQTGFGCYGCHQQQTGEAPAAKDPAAAKDGAGAKPAAKEAAAKEPAKAGGGW